MVKGKLAQETVFLVIGSGPGRYAAAFRTAELFLGSATHILSKKIKSQSSRSLHSAASFGLHCHNRYGYVPSNRIIFAIFKTPENFGKGFRDEHH